LPRSGAVRRVHGARSPSASRSSRRA
jgi:hypothetical protein